MMDREALEAIQNYGPSGSKAETRTVVDSHLMALGKLEVIERLCLATKKDFSEIRWVRIFATDVLRNIDPTANWDQIAYGDLFQE